MARSNIKWLGQPGVRDFLPAVADNSTITFDETKKGGSAAVGKAVTFSANGGTIELAADGDFVLGWLERVDGDLKCTVQIRGLRGFPGGTGVTWTSTWGQAIVGALDGSGNPGCVRPVNSAVAAELAKGRGRIFDYADTAAIQAYLE